MFDESFFRLVFVHDDDLHVLKEKMDNLEAAVGALYGLLSQDQKNAAKLITIDVTNDEAPRVLTDEEKKKLH